VNDTKVTRETHRGKACVFVDPYGQPHDALITEVWGPQCVNVVYCNPIEGQSDSYGQKMVRYTSVMHGNVQQAHGNYWLLPGETRQLHVPQPTDSAQA
jgi:hypothetical protein